MDSNSNNFTPGGESTISYREILDFIWRLRWWILVSVAAALIIAFFYVRMQPAEYRQSTWMMLNKGGDASPELRVISDLTNSSTSKRIDNEVFILKSPTMMSKVVENLRLNTRYYSFGTPVAGRVNFFNRLFGFKQYEYYGNQPFAASLVFDDSSLDKQSVNSLSLKFRHSSDSTYSVQELKVNGQKIKLETEDYSYGANIDLNGAVFCVSLTKPDDVKSGFKYMCTWTDPYRMGTSLSSRLSADIQKSQRSSYVSGDVVILSITDNIKARARDVLNALVETTNNEARDYSNIVGVRAVEFIDSRLAELSVELGAAESSYQSYRSSQSLVDISSQSQFVLSADQKNKERLDEVVFQIQVLQMVQDCIDQQAPGEYSAIPANVGVSDHGLNSIIANYNTLVNERERMVANSSETNPRVLTINSQLDQQKASIDATVAHLMNVYRTKQVEIRRNITAGKAQLSNMPRQQLQVQQLGRKLDVIEPLYLMLQQKKEETQIAMRSQTDNFRVIETAFGPESPISPKKSQIFLIAFILGLCLPPLVVWLRMMLRTTVETKSDITSRTDTPVIAVIAKKDDKNGSNIISGGRDNCSESFGMLRANLKYLPESQILQVTSSLAGEGKSFVASNLAVSLARLGKKVLIVGLDIRKPMLRNIFKEESIRARGTMVSYLLGKSENPDSLPVESSSVPGLSVIFAGPVPPNPMEVLARCNFEEFFGHFRSKYDYIIVDSAPYLPVNDSSFINPFVDATLYLVRSGFTNLKILDEFKDVTDDPTKPIKNVNIVLNGIDYSSKKYHYGYGKGYGYGYGYGYGHNYGYGYGYGDEGQKRRKGSDANPESDLGPSIDN